MLQMADLNARTGTQIIVIAARSNHQDFLRPYVWTSTPQLASFFHTTFNSHIADFAIKMEAYGLTGLSGTCFVPAAS